MTSPRACPICRRAVTETGALPFCSPRCRDIDLGSWLSGTYRVPTDEPPADANPDADSGGDDAGPDRGTPQSSSSR